MREAKPFLNKQRYWGNFLRFAAVGGTREPLIAPGEAFATTDPAVAQALFKARWATYEKALDRHQAGLPAVVSDQRGPTLADYAVAFLAALAAQRQTDGRPVHRERELDRRKRGILTCLETPTLQRVRYLSRLEPQDVDAMLGELSARRKADGQPLSAATVRSYALEFSAMLTYAVSARVLTVNPLPNSRYLPRFSKRTAIEDDAYLTRAELKALLDHVLPSPQVPYAIELAMTLVYTGMRREGAMALLEGLRAMWRSDLPDALPEVRRRPSAYHREMDATWWLGETIDWASRWRDKAFPLPEPMRRSFLAEHAGQRRRERPRVRRRREAYLLPNADRSAA